MTSRKRTRRKPHVIKWSPTQVPEYDYDFTEVRGEVKLWCHYCDHWFIVHKVTWLRASTYMTRPCPFCFKVNRIPHDIAKRYIHGPT